MSDDHYNDFQQVVIHLTWATAPIPRGSSSNSTKISSNDFPNALSKTFRVCLIEWGFPFEWSFPKFSHKLLGNKSVLDPAHCANLKISIKTKKTKPNKTLQSGFCLPPFSLKSDTHLDKRWTCTLHSIDQKKVPPSRRSTFSDQSSHRIPFTTFGWMTQFDILEQENRWGENQGKE